MPRTATKAPSASSEADSGADAGWLVDHLAEHAVALRRPLLKMRSGAYEGLTPCCNVLWRAVRTPGAITIRYIHIDLPGGQLLFGW